MTVKPDSLIHQIRGAHHVADVAFRGYGKDWIDGYKYALTRVETLLQNEDARTLTVTVLPLPAEVEQAVETLEQIQHACEAHYTYRDHDMARDLTQALETVKLFREKYNTELAER